MAPYLVLTISAEILSLLPPPTHLLSETLVPNLYHLPPTRLRHTGRVFVSPLPHTARSLTSDICCDICFKPHKPHLLEPHKPHLLEPHKRHLFQARRGFGDALLTSLCTQQFAYAMRYVKGNLWCHKGLWCHDSSQDMVHYVKGNLYVAAPVHCADGLLLRQSCHEPCTMPNQL